MAGGGASEEESRESGAGHPDASGLRTKAVSKGNQFPVRAATPSYLLIVPQAPANAPDFRRRLLRWFRQHGRDLPWRRTRNPYHVIVSEFMLQQTQVSRVESYYGRFLSEYPSIESLAAAPAALVRESWSGLGYYRRAANLHRLAQEVVRDRQGLIPSDPAELRQLPGIGRYTAGAVASFAFERH